MTCDIMLIVMQCVAKSFLINPRMTPKKYKCVNTQNFEYFAHSVCNPIPFKAHFYRSNSSNLAKYSKITNNKGIKVAFAESKCIFRISAWRAFSTWLFSAKTELYKKL